MTNNLYTSELDVMEFYSFKKLNSGLDDIYNNLIK